MTLAGQIRPALLLYQFFWEAVDWLFPPSCGGCGRSGMHWCDSCKNQVKRMPTTICPVCGDEQASSDLCPNCRDNPPAYLALRSYAEFQGSIREALHRLKFQRDVGLGMPLSNHLIELYNLNKWPVDFVTPVPLSPNRQKERGYNQAGLLGRPLAYAIDVPFIPGVITKKRETRTQVGLSAVERQQNVEKAFTASSSKTRGKVVLIVDDVTTTGSTINACAQALCEAGASAVYGLTLARAVLQADADDQPETIS